MFASTTRRAFIQSTAAVAATLPSLGAVFAQSSASAASPAYMSHCATSSAHISDDVLHALGERIGSDAALSVGADHGAVSLVYFDYAGASLDALRVGIESGLSKFGANQVASHEIELPYGAHIGVAVIRNVHTAVETRIEIDAAVLSQLAMIEESAPSAGIAKSAVMSADAAHFYRVADVV